MVSAVHTLISLPIGLYFENPLLILVTTVVLHLLADTFTHWNIYPHQFARFPYHLVAIDVAGGLLIAFVLLGSAFFTVPVLIAIFGGNLADIIHSFWEILSPVRRLYLPPWAQAFFRYHENLQRETPSLLRGLPSQLILAGIALVLVFWWRFHL
jgi:hypothetical protein